MEISYLHEFTVLAEMLNYWEASERLFMNQSTLSKHIKSMEKELDVPLFKRTTRQVELTEFGTAFLPYARKISEMQFQFNAEMLQKKNAELGLLEMGSITSMAQYGITSLLLEFQKQHANYSIRIIEDDTHDLIGSLVNKKCDLAFTRSSSYYSQNEPVADEMIASIPYLTDHLVAVVPKSNPLSRKKELTLKELKDEHLCLVKEGTPIYNLCMHAFLNADIVPNIVFDTLQIDSILDMCTKGNCVGLVMNKHVEYPEGSGHLREVPFTTPKIVPEITSTVSLSYLKNSDHSPAAKQFVEFFISQLPAYPKDI